MNKVRVCQEKTSQPHLLCHIWGISDVAKIMFCISLYNTAAGSVSDNLAIHVEWPADYRDNLCANMINST